MKYTERDDSDCTIANHFNDIKQKLIDDYVHGKPWKWLKAIDYVNPLAESYRLDGTERSLLLQKVQQFLRKGEADYVDLRKQKEIQDKEDFRQNALLWEEYDYDAWQEQFGQTE